MPNLSVLTNGSNTVYFTPTNQVAMVDIPTTNLTPSTPTANTPIVSGNTVTPNATVTGNVGVISYEWYDSGNNLLTTSNTLITSGSGTTTVYYKVYNTLNGVTTVSTSPSLLVGTPITLPSITINTITDNGNGTATLSGTLSSTGNGTMTDCGFIYTLDGTTPNYLEIGASNGTVVKYNNFTTNADLSLNTKTKIVSFSLGQNVLAQFFAKNEAGLIISNVVSLNSLFTTTLPSVSNPLHVITIGNYLLVSNYGNGYITIYNKGTYAQLSGISGNIFVGSGCHGLFFDGTDVYVGFYGTNAIKRLNYDSGNASTPFTLDSTFGTSGSWQDIRFNSPLGMVKDGNGNIYVANYGVPNILVFDSSRNYLSSIDLGSIQLAYFNNKIYATNINLGVNAGNGIIYDVTDVNSITQIDNLLEQYQVGVALKTSGSSIVNYFASYSSGSTAYTVKSYNSSKALLSTINYNAAYLHYDSTSNRLYFIDQSTGLLTVQQL